MFSLCNFLGQKSVTILIHLKTWEWKSTSQWLTTYDIGFIFGNMDKWKRMTNCNAIRRHGRPSYGIYIHCICSFWWQFNKNRAPLIVCQIHQAALGSSNLSLDLSYHYVSICGIFREVSGWGDVLFGDNHCVLISWCGRYLRWESSEAAFRGLSNDHSTRILQYNILDLKILWFPVVWHHEVGIDYFWDIWEPQRITTISH